MFNIRRFDLEDETAQESSSSSITTTTTTTPTTPINDRLAKLNARLNKNKPPPTSTTDNKTTIQDSIPHIKDTKDAKQHKRDRDSTSAKTTEISYKRSREEEDARVAREEARRQKDQQAGKQRWEKRAKELKDSDLVPNDVRLAMKAEAEAREKAEREAKKNPFAAAAAAAAAEKEEKEKEEDEDMKDVDADEDDEKDKESQDNQDQEEEEDEEDRPALELEGVERFASEAAADAALAELAALVPLPTFETKEITALEKERAKSMGIPDWLAHPTLIEPGESNNRPIEDQQFGFSERLIKQCKKAGIEECFAVQTAVIPVLMRARHLGDIRKAPGDLCVSAPTGSGKTLAYVLPIIEVTYLLLVRLLFIVVFVAGLTN